jgi:hypothetical protein
VTESVRKLDGWLTKAEWPRVPCSTCGHSALALTSFKGLPDAASAAAQKNPGWEPDWLRGVFTGKMKCSDPDCGETVAVSGDWKVVFVGHQHSDPYDELLRLRFAHPPLRLAALPDGTPESVAKGIDSASSVFWVSPSSAANRLRFSVEELLTARGVNKTAPKKSGGRRRLTTHERIMLYRAKNPDVADALEAVKWIGNDGSHDESLTVAEVMDGVEVLELALRLLYDTRDEALRRRITAIIKNKGVRKRGK